MKKATAGLLAILILFACLPALADAEDPELTARNRARIRWGIAMAAEMAGCAMDHLDEAGNERQRALLERFSGVDFLSPDKAIVLEFSKSEMNSASFALQLSGVTAWSDSATALAEAINAPYGEDYAQASRLARAEGNTTQENSRYFDLIILPYGEDIAIISLTAYGNVKSRGAFVTSMPEISGSLGREDIDRYLASYGLQAPSVSVYEKAVLDELMTREPWSSSASAGRMADTVLASDRRQAVLLPTLLRSDSAYLNAEFKSGILSAALEQTKTSGLALARQTAETWLPLLSEGQEDPVGVFLAIGDEADKGELPAPKIAYGTENQDADLKADGTYLVVFETVIPEKEPSSWTDMKLEAVLPAAQIPAGPEDADYIILCHTEYKGGAGSGGTTLHYPETRVTVHDAQTGAMLRDLGSVRRTLDGGAVLLPRGDYWWAPLRTMLWEKIRPLFADK